MKNKVLLIGAVVLVALLASAWAADLTGKWIAQVPGRQGTTETTFNFVTDGAKLTGTVTNPQGENPITEGKVDGNDISFVVVLNFNGNEVKLLYKGKVSGDEITFTRERQGGMMGGPGGGSGGGPGGAPGGGRGRMGRPQEFVAKRAK
jgi:opacity protein-like surface antigen